MNLADATLTAENRGTILQDSFIRAYIDDVLRSLRTQYLVDLIKPYTRMELSFLAKVSENVAPIRDDRCAEYIPV